MPVCLGKKVSAHSAGAQQWHRLRRLGVSPIYNQKMHAHHLFFALTLAWGQSPASDQAATPATPPSASTGTGAAVLSQHILVEDSAVRIDEQRRGGETQSISVQPKGGMPAYQVAPQTGERSWKVLGF